MLVADAIKILLNKHLFYDRQNEDIKPILFGFVFGMRKRCVSVLRQSSVFSFSCHWFDMKLRRKRENFLNRNKRAHLNRGVTTALFCIKPVPICVVPWLSQLGHVLMTSIALSGISWFTFSGYRINQISCMESTRLNLMFERATISLKIVHSCVNITTIRVIHVFKKEDLG